MNTFKSITVRFVFLTVIFALLLGAALTEKVLAQTSAQPAARERLSVTVWSVKPEMVTEYENMLKTETNPALQKGGLKWRNVWQTATFGNGFEYVMVAPIDNFAQYDQPAPIEKGMGNGIVAYRAKFRKMINGNRTTVIESRPDLSLLPPAGTVPKMAVVAYVQVAQNRNAEYENFIKNEWLPVVKQSGVAYYLVYQTLLGGNVNEYITVTAHENYAELEKGPPPFRVLGQEGGMKLMQKMPVGVVEKLERVVMRFNPELSFRPAATAQNKQP